MDNPRMYQQPLAWLLMPLSWKESNSGTYRSKDELACRYAIA